MDFDHNTRVADFPVWLISVIILAVAMTAVGIVLVLPTL